MTATPLADLKRELASALRVPCADPLHWPAQVAWNADLSLTGCPNCHGRGYTQPLMKTCRVTHSAVAEDGWARQANCEEVGCPGFQPRDFGMEDVLAGMWAWGEWTLWTDDEGVSLGFKKVFVSTHVDCDMADPNSARRAIVTAALDALRAQGAGA